MWSAKHDSVAISGPFGPFPWLGGRHPRTLVQPFKVQAGQMLPSCPDFCWLSLYVVCFCCHLVRHGQTVSLICHTDGGMVREIRRAPPSVWRAGSESGWTAHLDAQSMQAGVHYMLCLDLDGVLWMAFGCRWSEIWSSSFHFFMWFSRSHLWNFVKLDLKIWTQSS